MHPNTERSGRHCGLVSWDCKVNWQLHPFKAVCRKAKRSEYRSWCEVNHAAVLSLSYLNPPPPNHPLLSSLLSVHYCLHLLFDSDEPVAQSKQRSVGQFLFSLLVRKNVCVFGTMFYCS